MVQGNQMPVIREQGGVLGIIPAHRQTEQLRKYSALLIDGVEDHTVISCIGAAQIFKILRKIKGACRGASRMILIQSRNILYLIKIRRSMLVYGIAVNIYVIFQFVYNI